MDTILKALKNQKVSEYCLIEKTTYAKEWFFIKKKLDLSRAKKVRYFYLTVYSNIYESQDRFKGVASCKLTANIDEESLNQKIRELIDEANCVKNPYFELPLPQNDASIEVNSRIGNIHEVFETMEDFHEGEEVSLNSYEFFENMTEVRIVNSRGIDVSYTYPSHELELVINASDNTHEVEIYQDIRFGQPNMAELKRQIGDARRQAQDRKLAKKLTKENLPNRIMIRKENVLQLFEYYLAQLNCNMLYRKYSQVEIGDVIGPQDFHLEGLPFLDNSSRNIAYDEDGRLVQPITLIDQGKVMNVWGNHVSSCYLGKENTTMIYNYKVSPGGTSIEAMSEEPYLEIVQFSSFDCDPVTGDFGGEIRLAYLHQNEETTIVCGGSISGNIKENESTMKISKELEKYDHAVVPSAIVFEKVNIACD